MGEGLPFLLEQVEAEDLSVTYSHLFARRVLPDMELSQPEKTQEQHGDGDGETEQHGEMEMTLAKNLGNQKQKQVLCA